MSSPVVPNPELQQSGKHARFLFVLLILLNVIVGIVALRYVVQDKIFTDEVEHAHVSWAMSQGLMPYRDLHQIHTPLVWMVFSPLMAWLPHSAETMIVLRVTCLLAFIGSYIVGLYVLREILGPIGRIQAMVLLLLSLSVLPDFELYRFRPDPFMAFFTALAILAAVRLQRDPVRYSILGGIALGLAASFSPKMAPLCILVPVLCLLECRRRWTLRPLWLVFPNGLGFVIGILPVVLWFLYYGLLDSFWYWTVSGNAHASHFSIDQALQTMYDNKLIMVLTIFGGAMVVQLHRNEPKQSWPPGSGLIVGALLAWLVMVIKANNASYNLQAFAMPAAVLGTVIIVKIADSWPLWRRVAVVAAVLVLVATRSSLQGFDLPQAGRSIRKPDLQRLIDLCESEGATCVGFAPWHPIFCRDATDVYLNWDLYIPLLPWTPLKGQKPYLKMWAQAVPDIESKEPHLIVNQRIWKIAHRHRLLRNKPYRRFLEIVKTDYDPVKIGNVTAFVRKTAPQSQAE